jgi:hypothetical protein
VKTYTFCRFFSASYEKWSLKEIDQYVGLQEKIPSRETVPIYATKSIKPQKAVKKNLRIELTANTRSYIYGTCIYAVQELAKRILGKINKLIFKMGTGR